ncbi:hypothetical protein DIPPA_30737 [Diplonema papillatum]|nr:hypothetical protein DIPPA_30737 [Diplonema papillatum]
MAHTYLASRRRPEAHPSSAAAAAPSGENPFWAAFAAVSADARARQHLAARTQLVHPRSSRKVVFAPVRARRSLILGSSSPTLPAILQRQFGSLFKQ